MDREELQRTNLALLRQPALGHMAITQRNRIATPGNLRSHPADDEISAVHDEHEGRAAFDGGKVCEGERDRDQASRDGEPIEPRLTRGPRHRPPDSPTNP